MIRKALLLLTVSMLVLSCGQRNRPGEQPAEDMIVRIEALESSLSESERAFLENLAGLCGSSFRGKEIFTAPGRESWADREMVIHVTVCEQDRVHIPLHLDEDRSRTWMFLADAQGLRFRHDHRHEDGTPEDQTLYGGYADGTGTAFLQKFPADEYTVEHLDDKFNREWRVILSEDMSSLVYQLLYYGGVVFAAEFDLTSPV